MSKITIGVAGSKHTTYEFLQQFYLDGFSVDMLITIPPNNPQTERIAGYKDLNGLAGEYDIPVYNPQRYDLKTEKDRKRIQKMHLDVLLVIGWQRLIPPEVLDVIKIGAFGMHGSPEGLPKGRGRSPLNWSLILDKNKFKTSLFKYNKGIDAGVIVDTVKFSINDFDTCRTLHYKNRDAMNYIVKNNLTSIVTEEYEYTPQPDILPTYFPKRKPEDGGIDWYLPTSAIYNFIRALTKPFPGAFTFNQRGQKILIWGAKPYKKNIPQNASPGTVISKMANEDFVVKTGNGSLLVNNYEIPNNHSVEFKAGDKLESTSTKKQLSKITNRYRNFVDENQKEITVTSIHEVYY